MQQIIWKGKPVKTPKGLALAIPYPKLAAKVQEEWDKAVDKPDPKTMHYTTCAVSVIDIIANKRQQITADVSRFIHGDVIYYFDDKDEALIANQHLLWDKWKAYAERILQTPAKSSQGIMAIEQSDTYYNKAMELTLEPDDWHFYALQNFIIICHSWVLGYGIYEGEISPVLAIQASHADSLYQEQQWGSDEQATAERQGIINELQQIKNYLHLLAD